MAWAPGQSGNPGGRPKEDAEVKALARQHAPSAIEKLVDLMDCGQPRTEAAAAIAILDRAYGKPAQAIVGGDDDEFPLKIVTRIERVVVNGNAPTSDG
jgi:hypothetical protein